MKVRVTESHIERGRACHSMRCPLALAFQDATGEPWGVSSFSVTRLRDGYRIGLTRLLQIWVNDYDDGKPVQPIDFEVPLLSGVGA